MKSFQNRIRPTVLAAITLFLVSGRAFAATPIPVTNCDYLITASGNYYLASDLNCSSSPGVLIAASKVDLDLAGHTISSAAESIVTAVADPLSAGYAVCSQVTGVRIHNGTLSPGLLETGPGILICSPNASPTTMGVQVDHIVFNLFNAVGLELLGANKSVVIKNNYFTNSLLESFSSSGNHITGNLMVSQISQIFISGGGSNTVTGNVSHENSFLPAIQITSSINNLVQGNYADTGFAGISIFGSSTGNTISGNTAFNNSSFDLADSSDATCTLNTWSNNFFGTSSPGCIR